MTASASHCDVRARRARGGEDVDDDDDDREFAFDRENVRGEWKTNDISFVAMSIENARAGETLDEANDEANGERRRGRRGGASASARDVRHEPNHGRSAGGERTDDGDRDRGRERGVSGGVFVVGAGDGFEGYGAAAARGVGRRERGVLSFVSEERVREFEMKRNVLVYFIEWCE